MRNVTKLLALLLALFLFAGIVVSCDQGLTVDSLLVKTSEESSTTATDTTGTDTTGTDTTGTNTTDTSASDAGRVLIYYEGNSKSLTGSFVEYLIESGILTDEDVSAIKELMSGKTIIGMSFENLTEIIGKFADSAFTDTLKDLQFDGKLENIGEECFRNCVNLENVDFVGETLPEVAETSFPGKDEYTTNCGFGVPKDLAEEARDKFDGFIDDNGYLKVEVKILLNTNEEFYKTSDEEFGTPELPEKEINTYVGRSVKVSTPTNDGYSFLGFYADKETTETQIFDADGNAVSSVTSYTNEKGHWINSTKEVTLYAHWKAEYVYVHLKHNYEGNAEEITGRVIRGRSIPLLTGEQVSRDGYELKGWTTSTDGLNAKLYECGEKVTPTTDTTFYAQWEKQLSYYEKGAAFIKEYMGIELPEWDGKIGATEDNSSSWSTATGMHFYMNSGVDGENISSLNQCIGETLGDYYAVQTKEDTQEHKYTTATWFGYMLPENLQTDDYKMCRVEAGVCVANEGDNENIYPYLSIDVSFIKSAVGTLGTAGGYIFYDVDEDNSEENNGAGPDGLKTEDSYGSWRFLETAPESLEEISSFNAIDWGNFAVDGTLSTLGSGFENTSRIIHMADVTEYLDNYAAKICSYHQDENGKNDYFLPSSDELMFIFNNLYKKGLGGFSGYYWSSTQVNDVEAFSFKFYENSADLYNNSKDTYCKVRPVRRIPRYIPD